MNTKIIKIENQELINLIEKLHYEVNSRKDLIAYMLNNNMRTDTEAYEKYNREYREFYIQYNEAKNKLEEIYVRTAVENPINWNLDFETSEVTIEYAG
jgi:hypothetical protein